MKSMRIFEIAKTLEISNDEYYDRITLGRETRAKLVSVVCVLVYYVNFFLGTVLLFMYTIFCIVLKKRSYDLCVAFCHCRCYKEYTIIRKYVDANKNFRWMMMMGRRIRISRGTMFCSLVVVCRTDKHFESNLLCKWVVLLLLLLLCTSVAE